MFFKVHLSVHLSAAHCICASFNAYVPKHSRKEEKPGDSYCSADRGSPASSFTNIHQSRSLHLVSRKAENNIVLRIFVV